MLWNTRVERESGIGHALLRRLATARAVDRVRERRRGPGGPVPDWDSLQAPDASASRDLEDAELADRLPAPCWPGSLRGSPRSFACTAWKTSVTRRSPGQLAVSVAAVGVHLHRVRERLRELLSDSLDAPASRGRGPKTSRRSPS